MAPQHVTDEYANPTTPMMIAIPVFFSHRGITAVSAMNPTTPVMISRNVAVIYSGSGLLRVLITPTTSKRKPSAKIR
jgi:hypothetical protein